MSDGLIKGSYYITKRIDGFKNPCLERVYGLIDAENKVGYKIYDVGCRGTDLYTGFMFSVQMSLDACRRDAMDISKIREHDGYIGAVKIFDEAYDQMLFNQKLQSNVE
jgi:hypothetical protein